MKTDTHRYTPGTNLIKISLISIGRIDAMSDPDEIRNVGTDFVKLNGSRDNGEDDEGKKRKGWDDASDAASDSDEDDDGRAEDEQSQKKRDMKKNSKRKVSIKEEPEDIEEEEGEEGEEEEAGNDNDGEEDDEREEEEEGKGKKEAGDNGVKGDESQSAAPKAFFGKFIRALSGKGRKNNGGEEPSPSGETKSETWREFD